MSQVPLYVFDLDGTLALNKHRDHFIKRPKGQQDWASYFKACVDDQPNLPVLSAFKSYWDLGNDVWIWSGRSVDVFEETSNWLEQHTPLRASMMHPPRLQMRASGDYTPDEVLKQTWYNVLSPADKARLVAVYEDRDRVVAMWRRNLVTCFQVAPGDF